MIKSLHDKGDNVLVTVINLLDTSSEILVIFYVLCSSASAQEAMIRNAREALKVSQKIKKAAQKHREECDRLETESKAVVSGTSRMLQFSQEEVTAAHGHGQNHQLVHTDYPHIKRKVPRKWSIDEKVEKPGAQLDDTMADTSDYMKLIKTPEGFMDAPSTSDYQKLLKRDSPSTSEPDYDYTSSSENIYQPLLLDNMKGISNSRDSIYQALFSSPD